METVITIIDFLLFLIGIGVPVLLLAILKSKTKYYRIFYFLIGLLVLSGIIWLSTWWMLDKSNHILLEYYGYDIDGMSEKERFYKVLPENVERVKSIEVSIMGIGWPLKAIFGIIILSPYLLVVYFGNWIFENFRNSKKSQLIVAILLIGFLSCGRKFDKEKWNKKDDIFYDYRESMVKDLMKNHLKERMTYNEVCELLGTSEIFPATPPYTICYEIMVDFGWNIDPQRGKELYIEFTSDSILKEFRLVKWKH